MTNCRQQTAPQLWAPWRWGLKEWGAAATCWFVFYLAGYPIVCVILRENPQPAWFELAMNVFYAPVKAFLELVAGPAV